MNYSANKMAAKHCLSAQCIVVDIVPLSVLTDWKQSILSRNQTKHVNRMGSRVGRVHDQFKLFYMLVFGTANPFSEGFLQRRDVSLSFSKLYIIFRIG